MNNELIYKPKGDDEPIAQNAILGVKFSNDIFYCEIFFRSTKN